MEADLEGVVCLHCRLPGRICAVQTRPLRGPAGHHGAAHPLVPEAVHRAASHLPAGGTFQREVKQGGTWKYISGFLRVAGGAEVVGAVLQAALARHHRHLPQGAGAGPPRTQEGHRQAGQADRDEVRGGGVGVGGSVAD